MPVIAIPPKTTERITITVFFFVYTLLFLTSCVVFKVRSRPNLCFAEFRLRVCGIRFAAVLDPSRLPPPSKSFRFTGTFSRSSAFANLRSLFDFHLRSFKTIQCFNQDPVRRQRLSRPASSTLSGRRFRACGAFRLSSALSPRFAQALFSVIRLFYPTLRRFL